MRTSLRNIRFVNYLLETTPCFRSHVTSPSCPSFALRRPLKLKSNKRNYTKIKYGPVTILSESRSWWIPLFFLLIRNVLAFPFLELKSFPQPFACLNLSMDLWFRMPISRNTQYLKRNFNVTCCRKSSNIYNAQFRYDSCRCLASFIITSVKASGTVFRKSNSTSNSFSLLLQFP
jgi:hypothetical protein